MGKKNRGVIPIMLEHMHRIGKTNATVLKSRVGLRGKDIYKFLKYAKGSGYVKIDKSDKPYTYELTDAAKRYRRKEGSFIIGRISKMKQDIIALEKKQKEIDMYWGSEYDAEI